MSTAPAYYAKGTRGWRAWWTLLHPPYTLMHLSFVAVGAALAPTLDWTRFGFTLLAFLLAMGVAAHALDEWNGRPLGTRIPGRTLVGLAGLALAGAVAIGIWGAWHYRLLPGLVLVGTGALLVVAYNLEWWDGAVHNDLGFALAWGAFPVIVAYYAQGGMLDLVAFMGAAYATAASLVQRRLSTPARALRRRVEQVEGRIVHRDGQIEPIGRETLLKTPEGALRGLVLSTLFVGGALLVRHLAV